MTGRELIDWLNKLTPEQLDNFDLSVSEGGDENGNAEFFTLQDACCIGGGVDGWNVDAAADGVLEDGQPVLLFGDAPGSIEISQ